MRLYQNYEERIGHRKLWNEILRSYESPDVGDDPGSDQDEHGSQEDNVQRDEAQDESPEDMDEGNGISGWNKMNAETGAKEEPIEISDEEEERRLLEQSTKEEDPIEISEDEVEQRFAATKAETATVIELSADGDSEEEQGEESPTEILQLPEEVPDVIPEAVTVWEEENPIEIPDDEEEGDEDSLMNGM